MSPVNKPILVALYSAVALTGCASNNGLPEVLEGKQSKVTAVVLPNYMRYAENGGAGVYTKDKQHMLSLQPPLSGEYVNTKKRGGDAQVFVEMKMPPPVVTVRKTLDADITVYFRSNGAVLSDDSKSEIKRIISMLGTETKVTVNGFTDSVGKDEKNISLSEARVNAVVDYLTSTGVRQDSISSKHHGAGRPVSDNESVVGRALNRRVEINIADSSDKPIKQQSRK